ncbi:MAG TPA: hypothetical protein VF622_18235 [Segetibacter sp.]|jgi:hypothetical protein
MKTLFSTFAFILISFYATAQASKPGANARPSEQKEIIADNHLKKSIQQKQLSAPPERIADTSSQQANKKFALKKKKKKCCTKNTSKV